jgi:hypothetical protein
MATMTAWQQLAGPRGPWVHEADSEDLPLILEVARLEDGVLVRLDGDRMDSLDGVFREYAREFAFPEYFGWNWAAFDECMKSLANKPALAYLTIIARADRVLSAELDEKPTFFRQLDDIGRRWGGAFGLGTEWGGGEVPFHTVLVKASRSSIA